MTFIVFRLAFVHCIINSTARSGGSCFIELEIRSSLGKNDQERRSLSQRFQCCLPSLCFYSRYGGQSSVTVCSERVWGHIWWCHRQYESLTNWSQMPQTLALDVSRCKLRETTRTIATDSLLQGFQGRVIMSHLFWGISNWISSHKTRFQSLWDVHSINIFNVACLISISYHCPFTISFGILKFLLFTLPSQSTCWVRIAIMTLRLAIPFMVLLQ